MLPGHPPTLSPLSPAIRPRYCFHDGVSTHPDVITVWSPPPPPHYLLSSFIWPRSLCHEGIYTPRRPCCKVTPRHPIPPLPRHKAKIFMSWGYLHTLTSLLHGHHPSTPSHISAAIRLRSLCHEGIYTSRRHCCMVTHLSTPPHISPAIRPRSLCHEGIYTSRRHCCMVTSPLHPIPHLPRHKAKIFML